MPPGISVFLILFLIFEAYYFFIDYLFTGLYPFHGYVLNSLQNIPYLLITLFLYIITVFALYKITLGFIFREEWARKFAILFSIWGSLWTVWAMLIGNRVFENLVFFAIYVAMIIYLMSSYVKEYFEKVEVFTYGPYTLYTRKVHLMHANRVIDIYFFSSHKPKSGTPCAMPEGYEVGVNPRTKMHYLQKIGKVRPFKHGDYTLYTRKIQLKNVDREIDIYFFSSYKPKSGKPCPMPEGYKVGINKRSNMPYLKKKETKKAEEVNRKPSNVIYVVSKPQPGEVRGDWAVRSHGKIFSHHKTKATAIKEARKIAKQKNATVMTQNTDGTFSEGFKPRAK